MSDEKSYWHYLPTLLPVAGVVLGIMVFRRDRERLKISVKAKRFVGRTAPEMEIIAVNAGRRDIILIELGMDYDDGGWMTLHLNEKEGAILKEKQRHIVDLEGLDHLLHNPGSDAIPTKIWFRDSLGKKHCAKDAKREIRDYYQTIEDQRKELSLGHNSDSKKTTED